MIDDLRQMPAQSGEQVVARQSALGGKRLKLIGAQGAAEIVGRYLFVGPVADPGIGGVALAVLLELPEQVAQPAAEHASRRAAGEQSAESALEQIADASAHSTAGTGCRRRRGCIRWGAAEMLHSLPPQQSEDRHRHRRHPAATLGIRVAGATRALLHSVEDIK